MSELLGDGNDDDDDDVVVPIDMGFNSDPLESLPSSTFDLLSSTQRLSDLR